MGARERAQGLTLTNKTSPVDAEPPTWGRGVAKPCLGAAPGLGVRPCRWVPAPAACRVCTSPTGGVHTSESPHQQPIPTMSDKTDSNPNHVRRMQS